MFTTIINHNNYPLSTISITINSFLRMVSEPNKHQITINRDSSCSIGLHSLWPSFRFTSLLLRSWGKGAWNAGGGPLARLSWGPVPNQPSSAEELFLLSQRGSCIHWICWYLEPWCMSAKDLKPTRAD